MKARPTDLPDVLEIQPRRHSDDRGFFSETYRRDWFRENVEDVEFVQENQSLSRAVGTLRGLHFQKHPSAQGKLVSCTSGRLFDVAVDLRPGSPHLGSWVGVVLSAAEGNQLWIPAGFAHGFCSLTPDCVVSYKVTAFYDPEADAGIIWNDRDLAVEWPDCANPMTLSAKDAALPTFANLLNQL